MLVPSYSSGKTRSLRIPRVVFYCIIFTIFAVATVTATLYLRSERFAEQYRDTREYLYDTQATFDAFMAQTEEEQIRLMEESMEIYDQLTEEQRMARINQDLLRREQQRALNDLQIQLDDLEQALRDFDDERQAIIDGLSSRTVIAPVANLFESLVNSQAALLSYSTIFNEDEDYGLYTVYEPYEELTMAASVGFTSFAEPVALVTEEYLLKRIELLVAELELQALLMEDLQYYRGRMDPHLRNFPTLWPVTTQISSPFGWRRNPFGGRGSEFHSGLDLRAPSGTAIRAAGGGTVVSAGWQGGYGLTVVIDHGHGYRTLYAHNSTNLVQVGQRVERGDIIARVGTTGRVTGAHVHFEVIRNGTQVNPRPYMIEHWGG